MARNLYTQEFGLSQIDPGEEFTDGPADWLAQYAKTHPALDLLWLLAHADDGVIWGRVEVQNGTTKLTLSTHQFSSISPELTANTLQQLRLFGSKGELHLWRANIIAANGNSQRVFQARLINETTREHKTKCFDEAQILWGDRLGQLPLEGSGYTLVKEGHGLYHAVPMKVPEDKFGDPKSNPRRPLRLKIRHYLDYDEIGQARIYLSRLVELYIV